MRAFYFLAAWAANERKPPQPQIKMPLGKFDNKTFLWYNYIYKNERKKPMRYCIDYYLGLENHSIFDKVDELFFVRDRQFNMLKENFDRLGDKIIICEEEGNIPSKRYEFYKENKERFLIGFNTDNFLLHTIEKLHEDGIRYYISEPATTFEEATRAKELGVSELYIDGEIFFQMSKVKAYGLPIRVAPNRIFEGTSPYPGFLDKPSSAWIRPEDVDMYEEYIDTFEFIGYDKSKTEAFVRIYNEEKAWQGPLSLIVPGVGENVPVNRMLNSELTARRLNCGQVCRTPTGTCRLCHRQFELANPDLFIDKK